MDSEPLFTELVNGVFAGGSLGLTDAETDGDTDVDGDVEALGLMEGD